MGTPGLKEAGRISGDGLIGLLLRLAARFRLAELAPQKIQDAIVHRRSVRGADGFHVPMEIRFAADNQPRPSVAMHRIDPFHLTGA